MSRVGFAVRFVKGRPLLVFGDRTFILHDVDHVEFDPASQQFRVWTDTYGKKHGAAPLPDDEEEIERVEKDFRNFVRVALGAIDDDAERSDFRMNCESDDPCLNLSLPMGLKASAAT